MYNCYTVKNVRSEMDEIREETCNKRLDKRQTSDELRKENYYASVEVTNSWGVVNVELENFCKQQSYRELNSLRDDAISI